MDQQPPLPQQPPQAPPPSLKNRKQAPQKNIDDFWAAYTSNFPGKITTILPQNQHAVQKAKQNPFGPVQSEPVKAGYERARRECYATVDKISKECRRVNRRYRDIHFDMEFDLKMGQADCLETLVGPLGDRPFNPKSVKRISEIFNKPQFYIDGATPTDIRQGYDGDCWFLSGLSACVHRTDWIKTVCVHMDEQVGVYGFVFYRDGEWIHTVIDDRLYLTAADWDESVHEKWAVKQLNNPGNEDEYKRVFQTGSRALYFAQCSSENETWLPLIEKAYAKAHGDYRSISGGFTGEAIEDLTGGVTTELWTTDILDKDLFWKELLQVNQEFLFSCATGWSDNFLGGSFLTDRKGVVAMHAYSVMEAREVEGQRLLKLRNPWGKSEWKGAWSDGSAEWTPEWMNRLNHKFGDDGVFWMSYEDLRRKFSEFDRTRLFNDPAWKVSQHWASLDVPWSAEYNTTKFEIEVKQAGRCVIVLSQLDDRYFKGLEGQYQFSLQFRIENKHEEGYIVRSNETYFMSRSCNVELDLEPGTYTVLVKIDADRFEHDKSPEHVIRETFKTKRNKLLQVGLAYDLAHAKAIPYETPEDIAARKRREKAEKDAAKAKAKKDKRDERWAEWERNMRNYMRSQRTKERRKRHQEKKDAQKQAEREAREAEAAKAKPGTGEEEEENTAARSSAQNEAPGETEAAKVDQEQADSVDNASASSVTQAAITLADAEAKFRDLMSQAEAIMAQAKAANEAASKPATTAAPSIVTTNADTQIDVIPTPTSSNEETPKPDPAPPAGPVVPFAPTPHPALNVPELLLPEDADPGADAASITSASSASLTSVLSWRTSIDSKLDSIAYASSSDSSSTTSSEDADNVPIANDPWNAVCVVGLRVFSKSDVLVRVVRPETESEMIRMAGEQPLDVDDISKAGSGDKSVVGSAEVQRESVDGRRPPLGERTNYGESGLQARRLR